jgi:uncharacterized damage-inducible protein DinB
MKMQGAAMTADTFTLLARYNRGVNEKMGDILRSLSDEDWNREFKGFFPSIRSVCSHIYICDFVWLKRFGGLREFGTLKAALFGEKIGFGDLLFPGREAYFSARPVLDEKIAAFMAEVTDADIPRMLKYSDSHGTVMERPFGHVLLQIFNHQTHHRGMISLYLEFLGRENDFSGVMPYLA